MKINTRTIGLLVILVLALGSGGVLQAAEEPREPKGGPRLEFTDARRQAAEFIAHYHRISLTPAQKAIHLEALSALPAPCCADYSIATCCCPCNLAKSVWGLSHYLIAEHGYGVQQVRDAAQEWMNFTNKDGYTGDSCYLKRCNHSFEDNGCGGMNERVIR